MENYVGTLSYAWENATKACFDRSSQGTATSLLGVSRIPHGFPKFWLKVFFKEIKNRAQRSLSRMVLLWQYRIKFANVVIWVLECGAQA